MQTRERLRSVFLGSLLLVCPTAGYAQGVIVATPNPLNLDTTTGPDVYQSITLTTASTTAIPFTAYVGNTSWLTVTAGATGMVAAGSPATVTLHANSAGLTPNSMYNAGVLVTYGSSAQTLTIQVNYNVVVVTGLNANPPDTSWVYAPGGAVPPPQVVTLSSSASTFSAQVSQNAPWLLLGIPNPAQNFVPQSGLNGYPTSGGFTLVFNPLPALAPGTDYGGQVTVTDASGNVTIVVVTLDVVGAGSSFTISPGAVTLTTSGPAVTTTLTSAAPNPTPFTATAIVTTPPGSAWLSVTSSGITPQSLLVTANPTGLPPGTYTGSITATGGGLSSVVQVTFVVNGPAGLGNVVSSSASLNFSYQVGGIVPLQPQSLLISDAIVGTVGIPFTVSAVVPAGTTSWLSAAVQGGGTQGTTGTSTATVLVTVNPQGLPPGIYPGTVNITPAGGNVLGIQVTLTVQGSATVAASPLQLSYSYQIGGTVPAAQAVQVTGNAASLPFAVVTSTTSGGNWLSTSASAGATPATLNVTANPGTLTAGSYQGTVTVAGSGTGPGSSTGTTNISVVLTITAGSPSITFVQNAASFSNGPVAPGEIVSIFGSTIGPAIPVGTTLTSAGTVSTNIGGVQVLFNGTPAPLTYVSATQINCVAPYEFALVTSPYVQVKYLQQSSNIFSLLQAVTAPGIFAASSGQGQGAILNGDNTYNSSAIPAAKGSTVQVFMTGEGLLSPPAATGSVTCSTGCTTAPPPQPALKVAALINGQPATIAYYGEASGDVSGVLQVNVVIPPNTPSGAVSIVISVGGAPSQNGVTVAVQ